MGNIQNAALSAIGSGERAIGVMKYFVNEEEKLHNEDVNKFLKAKQDEVVNEGKKAIDATQALTEAQMNAKNYRGKNYQKGQEKVNIAQNDLDKAKEAAIVLARNYVALDSQRNGSLFAKAGLIKKSQDYKSEQVGAAFDRMEKSLDKPKKFKPDGTRVGGGTL